LFYGIIAKNLIQNKVINFYILEGKMDGFSGPFSSLPGAGPGEGTGSGVPIGTGIFCGFAPEPTEVHYEWDYPQSPRSVYSQEHQEPDSEDEREYLNAQYKREIAEDESAYRLEQAMDGW
jgi:hypothetical protein